MDATSCSQPREAFALQPLALAFLPIRNEGAFAPVLRPPPYFELWLSANDCTRKGKDGIGSAFSPHGFELKEMAELESSMADMNSELPDALAQAIRVRTAWERAEEVKRVKQLVASRQEHVIETGQEMGFTSHVSEIDVEDEEEIIISLERFVETKSGSKGGMFGGSSMF